MRLVELHALGRLGPVGRDRALGALRRDRARARWRAAGRPGSGRRTASARRSAAGPVSARKREVGQRRTARAARPAAMPQKLPGSWRVGADRGADQRAEQAQPPGQASRPSARRDALAHQRAPGDRRGDGRQHRVGVGWPSRLAAAKRRNTDCAPRASTAGQHAPARVASGVVAPHEQRARRRRRPRCAECRSSSSMRTPAGPAAAKRRSAHACRPRARSTALRADDGRPPRPAPCSARCRPRARPRAAARIGVAVQVDVGRRPRCRAARGRSSPPASCTSGSATVGLERLQRRVEHRRAVQAA